MVILREVLASEVVLLLSVRTFLLPDFVSIVLPVLFLTPASVLLLVVVELFSRLEPTDLLVEELTPLVVAFLAFTLRATDEPVVVLLPYLECPEFEE